jgi:RimJ/RimL family protein N-acetyltransferase
MSEAAAPAARRVQAPRLRPTLLSDLDFVVAVERDPANLPFITPWDRTQHEGAVRIPDFRHFVVELPAEGGGGGVAEPVGFVILQGCRNPQHAVELKRIVLKRHGQGLGRACLRLLADLAFSDLRAHRFWLDVKSHNVRALALYRSEGFVEEGRLREAVRWSGPPRDAATMPAGRDPAWDDLIVLSLLACEHAARRAQGLPSQSASW